MADDERTPDREDQPEEVQGEETVVEEEPKPQEPGAADAAPADSAEAAAEAPAPERKRKDSEEPKKEQVPGAELDPIQIEPERRLTAEEAARLEAEAEERARLEAAATAETSEEEPVARRKVELPAEALIQATGKRKSSIARVILRPGEGKFEVNERSVEEYFPRENLRTVARQALLASGYEEAVDVRARVHGGGISGQAGAVRHGIARALCEIDPELRAELKRRGMLTRDPRKKERRKAGLKKARKRPQFSKR
jgi:small subunit ribosomal protein S9